MVSIGSAITSPRTWARRLVVAACVASMTACAPGRQPNNSPAPTDNTGTPAAPKSPSIGDVPSPRVWDISEGQRLPASNGLLFVDLKSARLRFWSLPSNAKVTAVSLDGRWVVWGASGVQGTHLLETATGNDRVLSAGGQPVSVAGLSADGLHAVLVARSAVYLVDTETGSVVAAAATSSRYPNGAAEFSVTEAAVVGSIAEAGVPPNLILLRPNGTSSEIKDRTWPIRWSPSGDRFVASGQNTLTMFNADGGKLLDIELGPGATVVNPRWSSDGSYVAVANSYTVGGQRVFRSSDGREVLRTEGTPSCLGEYWLDQDSLRFGTTSEVQVPTGETQSSPPTRDEYTVEAPAEPDLPKKVMVPDGRGIPFYSDGPLSYFVGPNGIQRVTLLNQGLLMVGSAGGHGTCDAVTAPLSVMLGPFGS